MKFRNEITLKVNSIIRKYIFSAQEVNVDQYLDYLETIFQILIGRIHLGLIDFKRFGLLETLLLNSIKIFLMRR